MAGTPAWVEHVSSVFPVRHLSEALQTGFDPFETGAGFELVHLGRDRGVGRGGAAVHAALLLLGAARLKERRSRADGRASLASL